MATFINETGINYIDIGFTWLQQDFIGNAVISSMILLILLFIVLAILTPRREIILLVPAPAIIAVANTVTSLTWVKITALIIAGVYFGLVIARIAQRDIF